MNWDGNHGYFDGSGGADIMEVRAGCCGHGDGGGSGYSYGDESGPGYGNHIKLANEDGTGHGGGDGGGDRQRFTHFLMSRLHD